jgi:hypothetical protein
MIEVKINLKKKRQNYMMKQTLIQRLISARHHWKSEQRAFIHFFVLI